MEGEDEIEGGCEIKAKRRDELEFDRMWLD